MRPLTAPERKNLLALRDKVGNDAIIEALATPARRRPIGRPSRASATELSVWALVEYRRRSSPERKRQAIGDLWNDMQAIYPLHKFKSKRLRGMYNEASKAVGTQPLAKDMATSMLEALLGDAAASPGRTYLPFISEPQDGRAAGWIIDTKTLDKSANLSFLGFTDELGNPGVPFAVSFQR